MSHSTSIEEIRAGLALAKRTYKAGFDPTEDSTQRWLFNAEILLLEIDRLTKQVFKLSGHREANWPDAPAVRVVSVAAAEEDTTDGRRAPGGLVITKAEPYAEDDDCLIAQIYRRCRDHVGPHDSDAIAARLEARSGSVYNALCKLEVRGYVTRVGSAWMGAAWCVQEAEATKGSAPTPTDAERLATIRDVAVKVATAAAALIGQVILGAKSPQMDRAADTLRGVVRQLLDAAGVDRGELTDLADSDEADDTGDDARDEEAA